MPSCQWTARAVMRIAPLVRAAGADRKDALSLRRPALLIWSTPGRDPSSSWQCPQQEPASRAEDDDGEADQYRDSQNPVFAAEAALALPLLQPPGRGN